MHAYTFVSAALVLLAAYCTLYSGVPLQTHWLAFHHKRAKQMFTSCRARRANYLQFWQGHVPQIFLRSMHFNWQLLYDFADCLKAASLADSCVMRCWLAICSIPPIPHRVGKFLPCPSPSLQQTMPAWKHRLLARICKHRTQSDSVAHTHWMQMHTAIMHYAACCTCHVHKAHSQRMICYIICANTQRGCS